MRGSDELTGSMFSYVNIEARIPANHPIRIIRRIVNEVLAGLDAEFTAMYSGIGQPSIAPARLLRGSLLQIIFSIRSERPLMEQMDCNLMFVGLWGSAWTIQFGTTRYTPKAATACSRPISRASS